MNIPKYVYVCTKGGDYKFFFTLKNIKNENCRHDDCTCKSTDVKCNLTKFINGGKHD